jgi:hypothetical protein
VRAGGAADLAAIGLGDIENVRSRAARKARRVLIQVRPAVVPGGAAQHQEPVDIRQVDVGVVRVCAHRRGEDAVHRRVDAEVVLHDFARQVHALPAPGGGTPAVGVVAGVVRVPATVNQQVAATAIPGKTAPRLDDLGRVGLSPFGLGRSSTGGHVSSNRFWLTLSHPPSSSTASSSSRGRVVPPDRTRNRIRRGLNWRAIAPVERGW